MSRWSFGFVGGSPADATMGCGEQARITHTIADLGLEDQVILRGGEPSDRVSLRLADADVLLHASVAEGIPNVVLEAMACAVPVVATDVGGISEAISDGVEGILVAPRDPGQLAHALLQLARDRALRERMGAAGRRGSSNTSRSRGKSRSSWRCIARWQPDRRVAAERFRRCTRARRRTDDRRMPRLAASPAIPRGPGRAAGGRQRLSDGTARVLERYGERIVRLEEARGPAAARNAGARGARGEVVAFTDADCRVDPDWLGQSSSRSKTRGWASPAARSGRSRPLAT